MGERQDDEVDVVGAEVEAAGDGENEGSQIAMGVANAPRVDEPAGGVIDEGRVVGKGRRLSETGGEGAQAVEKASRVPHLNIYLFGRDRSELITSLAGQNERLGLQGIDIPARVRGDEESGVGVEHGAETQRRKKEKSELGGVVQDGRKEIAPRQAEASEVFTGLVNKFVELGEGIPSPRLDVDQECLFGKARCLERQPLAYFLERSEAGVKIHGPAAAINDSPCRERQDSSS